MKQQTLVRRNVERNSTNKCHCKNKLDLNVETNVITEEYK
ncbi:13914_t:CDS:2 [Cetraspora pellucida]|uniref:13914_t:CDS:1 n=1 Tax=Cetraspora pellucida TaxID=1433469 RepID=A0A9N9DBL4_9GLOM|nr:13914_t:CDS:2 [Cetraspora pellucida]